MSPNTVMYTGTHDNNTTRGWFQALPEDQRERVRGYLKRPDIGDAEISRQLIELAWTSPAAVAIAPFQDLLNLGGEARMNVPGRASGNWRWRCTNDELGTPAFGWLRDLTTAAKRTPQSMPAPLTARDDHTDSTDSEVP